jgi:hypothetical protein
MSPIHELAGSLFLRQAEAGQKAIRQTIAQVIPPEEQFQLGGTGVELIMANHKFVSVGSGIGQIVEQSIAQEAIVKTGATVIQGLELEFGAGVDTLAGASIIMPAKDGGTVTQMTPEAIAQEAIAQEAIVEQVTAGPGARASIIESQIDPAFSRPAFTTGYMTLFSDSDKEFESRGDIKVGTSNDIFSNLGYTLPFSGSGVNTYITSLVSKQFIKGFEPTYLQIPYIYSGADNLINGNYKSYEVKDGNKIITTYYIPYKGLNDKEQIATIVTYYDITTNILFYEVPSEFSYNSLTKLSVAASQISDKEYSFKVLIPEDWVSPLFGNANDEIANPSDLVRGPFGQQNLMKVELGEIEQWLEK